MAAYRIKVAETFTDAFRDEFEFTGVSLELRIGAAGAMSGQIPIAGGDKKLGARIAAVPASGASVIYAYRNGAPWWGGMLWTKTLASDEEGHPSVALGAGTFESYLDRVQLTTDLPALTGDQLDIARSYIAHLQADPNANISLTCDTILSGITRTSAAYPAASRPTYLKVLSDLATQDQGFEYAAQILTEPTTGARTRRLRLGYPTLASATTHRLSKPGAILSYSVSEDGTRAATSLMATGNGVNSTVHTNAAALANRYPRLDLTTSYGSITDVPTLEAHAAADLTLAAPPFIIPAVRVSLDRTDLTPQSLGDVIHLNIVDELFPDGITTTSRLVGMTIAPDERGQAETCDLILN